MSKPRLQQITIAVLSAAVLFFGYFYWKKLSPLEVIPVGAITNAPEYKLSMYGDSTNPLLYPAAVAVRNGEVFVSDSERAAVDVFDYNGKLLRVIGNGTQKLKNPYGLAFNGDELYIADGGQGKIAVYTPAGEFKRYWEPKDKDTIVAPSQLVIKDNKLMYADLALNAVFVYDLDGNPLLNFGGGGRNEGQMIKPHGLAVDSQGNFFVADSNNNRVEVFDPNGKFVRIVGKDANSNGEILTPRGLAIDSNDNLYVVSGMENRVYSFNNKGALLFTFNQTSDKDSTISLPSGIAVDGDNRVLVTEYGGNRVSMFQY